MLEIYLTRMEEINNRTVSRLERVDEIMPDCCINLSSPTEDELRHVEQALNVPPEFLRYPLDEEERPRIDIDDDGDHVLIIADFPYIRREGTNAKYETQPVGIVLSGKCVITISLREASVLDQFKANRVRDFITGYRTRFTFQIMFAGAKDYLKLLRFMDKTIDAAEHQLNKSISNKELFKLMELGKSLIYFSTSLKSNEAVLEKLMRGKFVKNYEEDEDLLEDVITENQQAIEMVNISSSILTNMMDAFASIISNNLNVVMKFLASVTILVSLPTIVTGFYGMNVGLPLQNLESAWLLVLGFILLIVGAAIWLFFRRQWF
jgi:magnesium transporter